MFKGYFMILLLGHILGDFYVQTKKVAEKKEKSIKWLLYHCFCYWMTMLLVCLPIMSGKLAFILTVAAIFQLLIDSGKFKYLLIIRKREIKTQIIERNVFFVDQLLHLTCVIGLAYWLAINQVPIKEWKIINDFFKNNNSDVLID